MTLKFEYFNAERNVFSCKSDKSHVGPRSKLESRNNRVLLNCFKTVILLEYIFIINMKS